MTKVLTRTFTLFEAKKKKAVLATGRSFTIDQLFLYCEKRTTFSLYIELALGYRNNNTSPYPAATPYYIYKDEPLYTGIQYNRLLGYYDAKNRAWVEQSEHKPLVFNFDVNAKLIAEISDLDGGQVDILCNVIK